MDFLKWNGRKKSWGMERGERAGSIEGLRITLAFPLLVIFISYQSL